MIFFLFKPLHIKQQEFVDVPLLNMHNFVMYELDRLGLQKLMSGNQALRYKDRYVMNSVDFTDNGKEFIANMKADHALYKNNIVNLNGNITYVREDGLTFKTPSLIYNTTTSLAKTNDAYKAYRDNSIVTGKTLKYNAKFDTLKSKNVTVKYQLEESK